MFSNSGKFIMLLKKYLFYLFYPAFIGKSTSENLKLSLICGHFVLFTRPLALFSGSLFLESLLSNIGTGPPHPLAFSSFLLCLHF